jgi:hypothetical protein
MNDIESLNVPLAAAVRRDRNKEKHDEITIRSA